jgi:hypothetical protein
MKIIYRKIKLCNLKINLYWTRQFLAFQVYHLKIKKFKMNNSILIVAVLININKKVIKAVNKIKMMIKNILKMKVKREAISNKKMS